MELKNISIVSSTPNEFATVNETNLFGSIVLSKEFILYLAPIL